MNVYELRDADEARHVLLQGYLLQRLQTPRASGLASVLDLAIDLAGSGTPLPPLGVLADLAHLLLQPHATALTTATQVTDWSEHRALAYEDHVLGKWLADTSLDRAGDALRPFQGADRGRGVAFVFAQLRARCGFGGVLLSPAFLKKLRQQHPDQVLAAAWDSLGQYGLLPILPLLYDDLENHIRRTTAMLGPEDIFELEHRTALSGFSQRVALRQVLQATASLAETLPARPPASPHGPREVPTHLRDEDAYPVGGFTSLSNRGSVESMLHSQLAFMEDDRPDLFDIKFLRDELLYYARDENQFFRRRRTFVYMLYPDLVHARVKDPESHWQRIVLALALIVASTERLMQWLGDDSLFFDVLFLHDDAGVHLDAEQSLMEMVLCTPIANQTARVAAMSVAGAGGQCANHARRSLVDGLLLTTGDAAIDGDGSRVEGSRISSLHIGNAGPVLRCGEFVVNGEGRRLESWMKTLHALVARWAG